MHRTQARVAGRDQTGREGHREGPGEERLGVGSVNSDFGIPEL